MTDKLQTNELGSTGIHVPGIVFGTSNLGNLYQALADETKLQIVGQWFQHAPTPVMVDTAGKYGAGLALESIASALEKINVEPHDIIISNKLGWRRVPLETEEPTFEPGAWVGLKHDAVQDISYDGILRCYEQGCELLGAYRPQMVSVHDPDEYLAAATDEANRQARWQDILEAYKALQELRRAGKVAGVGVGSKDWRVVQQLTEHCELDWVMLATSYTIYTHPAELTEFIDNLHQRNIGVINSAVFHSGFMTGGQFFDYRKINEASEEDQKLIAWRDRFHKVCDQHNVKPAEACVAFALKPPGITAIALSSSQPERVAANVQLASTQLPEEFWAAMRSENLL
ncbi:MAG: aldo/keto reductase [Pirellulales bacterium]